MRQHFYDHQEKITRKSYYQLSPTWCVCVGYALVSGDSGTNLSLVKAMEWSSYLSVLKTFWSILHSLKLLNFLLFLKLGRPLQIIPSLLKSFLVNVQLMNRPRCWMVIFCTSWDFFFLFWHHISVVINLFIF